MVLRADADPEGIDRLAGEITINDTASALSARWKE